MEGQTELIWALRVILATIFGALIGLEREWRGHDAGIRTFAAVTLGSCVFAIISQASGSSGDANRISAQVVSGIGFLGGGVILRGSRHVSGLTTSATLWASASVGLAIGYGLYLLATVTTVLCILLLLLRLIPGVAQMRNSRVQSDKKASKPKKTETETDEAEPTMVE
ncbi:MAG: MgtC/SapB family protein [Chloroflexi bacterium]|nr:MgtC/SapB family protein [Chloroflexota bacterium]